MSPGIRQDYGRPVHSLSLWVARSNSLCGLNYNGLPCQARGGASAVLSLLTGLSEVSGCRDK
jgi:hypothetical protein